MNIMSDECNEFYLITNFILAFEYVWVWKLKTWYCDDRVVIIIAHNYFSILVNLILSRNCKTIKIHRF